MFTNNIFYKKAVNQLFKDIFLYFSMTITRHITHFNERGFSTLYMAVQKI